MGIEIRRTLGRGNCRNRLLLAGQPPVIVILIERIDFSVDRSAKGFWHGSSSFPSRIVLGDTEQLLGGM